MLSNLELVFMLLVSKALWLIIYILVNINTNTEYFHNIEKGVERYNEAENLFRNLIQEEVNRRKIK